MRVLSVNVSACVLLVRGFIDSLRGVWDSQFKCYFKRLKVDGDDEVLFTDLNVSNAAEIKPKSTVSQQYTLSTTPPQLPYVLYISKLQFKMKNNMCYHRKNFKRIHILVL